ncbi:hypothetical protein Scep_024744 [Stephania cephalantha]|uniref:Uncharacterized protein n=1 Tax=Stephania cephalantha TaxID=152367 RepID=A0AAP0EXV3_9MAGN
MLVLRKKGSSKELAPQLYRPIGPNFGNTSCFLDYTFLCAISDGIDGRKSSNHNSSFKKHIKYVQLVINKTGREI